MERERIREKKKKKKCYLQIDDIAREIKNEARKTKMSSKQLVVFHGGLLLTRGIYWGLCAVPPVSRKASMWGRKTTRVKIFA